jgi:hypothetical protein
MHTYQAFNLATVRLLQRPKAADIEWLEEVRGMRRHAERDDVVLLAIELESQNFPPIGNKDRVVGVTGASKLSRS